MVESHVPIFHWNSHRTPPFQYCNHASDFSVHVQMGLKTLKQLYIDACHLQENLRILPYYIWRGLQQVPGLPVVARWPRLHLLLLWEGLSVPTCHNQKCWIRHTKHTKSSFKTHLLYDECICSSITSKRAHLVSGVWPCLRWDHGLFISTVQEMEKEAINW